MKLVKVEIRGDGAGGGVGDGILPPFLCPSRSNTQGMISNVNHCWGRLSGGGQESVDTGQMVAVGPILVLFIK